MLQETKFVAPILSLLAMWLMPLGCFGQYHFSGQTSPNFKNKDVYLSLVEDYRKTERIYWDQIIQKTKADSLGNFSFSGNTLPAENRIYRVHVDACENSAKHFLQACTAFESILFIAHNKDTISLPLDKNEQAFCNIRATNDASSTLLHLDHIKEELIIDVLDQPSEKAKVLTLKKWMEKLQNTALELQEPLAELYCYSFLSNRANETYTYYIQNLEHNPYYNDLSERLNEVYPESPYTAQFHKELKADHTLLSLGRSEKDSQFNYALYVIVGLLGLAGLFFAIRLREKPKTPDSLQTLSAQEKKILDAILAGKSNKEIASEFFISLSTVKSHINSIYKKLGVTSRNEILSGFGGKR